MCIYKRCCCCCSVLIGAKIIAIISFVLGFIPLLTDTLIVLKLNGYSIPNAFMDLTHSFPSGAWAAGYDSCNWHIVRKLSLGAGVGMINGFLFEERIRLSC